MLPVPPPGLASGTTRYVNPHGLCGSSTPCYPNPQSASDASSPGDLIGAQGGLYNLSATVLMDRSVEVYGPQPA